MTDTAPPLTLDDILAQAQQPAFVRVATARVLLRQELHARHAELDAELTKAVEHDRLSNEEDTHPGIAAQILELEAEIEAAKVEFRFKCIGHRAWFDLMAKHPPTKEQREADRRADHNPATFPPAAMAACCIQPANTTAAFFTALDQSENVPSTVFDYIWSKCIDANIGGLADPKSDAAGVIRRMNARSVNTRAPAASPEVSSLDGS